MLLYVTGSAYVGAHVIILSVRMVQKRMTEGDMIRFDEEGQDIFKSFRTALTRQHRTYQHVIGHMTAMLAKSDIKVRSTGGVRERQAGSEEGGG